MSMSSEPITRRSLALGDETPGAVRIALVVLHARLVLRQHQVVGQRGEGPIVNSKLVAEVLSPSTEAFDRGGPSPRDPSGEERQRKSVSARASAEERHRKGVSGRASAE